MQGRRETHEPGLEHIEERSDGRDDGVLDGVLNLCRDGALDGGLNLCGDGLRLGGRESGRRTAPAAAIPRVRAALAAALVLRAGIFVPGGRR